MTLRPSREVPWSTGSGLGGVWSGWGGFGSRGGGGVGAGLLPLGERARWDGEDG